MTVTTGLTVYLSAEDVALGEEWARWMTDRAWSRGYKDRVVGKSPTTPEADLEQRVTSLCAEISIARHLDLPWHPPNEQSGRHSPDVGHNVGVRWSRLPALTIYEDDPSFFVYFLVRGTQPWLHLEGSIVGLNGKRPEFWRPDYAKPAYGVPIDALTPVQART